ncbi:MAG: ATP-binding protein [Lysobacterales bacterium]
MKPQTLPATALNTLAIATPWILALAYLGAIGYLGNAFHQLAEFEVTQITDVEHPDRAAQKLGLVRRVDDPPQTTPFIHQFEGPDDGQDIAVFIPRMNSTAQIFVNDHLVHNPPTTFRTSYKYQPQWIPVPPKTLKPSGLNELRINLKAESTTMMLSTFYVGPAERLEPVYVIFDFFRQDLLLAALAASVLLGLFMATIWVVRPQLAEYGWLALAFLAFSYYLYSFVGHRQIALSYLANWSYLLARAMFLWAFVCFTHRFLEIKRRWLEIALGVFYLAVFGAGLALVLSGRNSEFANLTFMTSMPMVLLGIIYVSSLLAVALIRRHHVYLHWLLVGSLLGLLLGLHDVAVLFDVQHWLIRDFYLSHYAIVFMSAGYGGVLVHRIARALLNSQDLNDELNRRLDAKTEALEQESRQRVASERQIALYQERQRIMADMHDGVGGQLVGLIAANRRGELDPRAVGEELDAILADLRMVLDALTPAGEDLVLAMARLKERYEPLLRSAGITLHWTVDSKIEQLPMAPGHTINVLRFVQEAVQNVVKHAAAQHLWLTLEQHAEETQITVRDDGKGAPELDNDNNPSSQGYGTRTMKRRATAVGGQFSRCPSPEGGTQVLLSLPN